MGKKLKKCLENCISKKLKKIKRNIKCKKVSDKKLSMKASTTSERKKILQKDTLKGFENSNRNCDLRLFLEHLVASRMLSSNKFDSFLVCCG